MTSFPKQTLKAWRAAALCALVFGGEAWGQPDTLWTRSYRMQSNPVCQRLVPTSDGGFALGVQTDNNNNNDWGLIKVDSTGRREWSRTYRSDDTVGTLDDVFQGLAAAPDGGYYLTGMWNNNRAQLMRVDEEGREIWSNNYEIRDDDFFTDISITQDGSPICAGWTHGVIGSLDAYLVKISSDGGVLWHHAYGGRGTDDFLRVIPTSDGGYMAVGSTTSYGGMKAYAVKTDSEGNQEWARTLNANRENHVFTSVVESPVGGYLAVGNGEFNGSLRLYWARMTVDGDSLWSGVLEHENGGAGYLLDATYAPNGGFLIVGKSSEYEYAAFRLDQNGEILWRFDFGDYPDQELIEAVLTLEDGGYALAGRKGNPPISTDAWLVRTAPDSEFNSVQLLNPSFPSSSSLSPPYPSPFNSSITIPYTLVRPGVVRIALFDLAGREVAVLTKGGVLGSGYHQTTWNASGQSAGVYIVRLEAGGEAALTTKVTLVK